MTPEERVQVNLADYEAQARATLEPAAWAYLGGGAGDEHTLRDNHQAWQRLRLQTRVLRDLAGGHTRGPLLGRTLAHPVMLAPVACQRLAHPDGEAASALAAAAQGAGFVLSSQSSVAAADVARLVRDEPGRGPLWHQLYWPRDRGLAGEWAAEIARLGFEALVLTVDAPVHGARDRERRAGFSLPAGLLARAPVGVPARPRVDRLPHQSALFDDLLLDAPGWADVEWLAAHSPLPLLLKGVLHPDDARLARQAGAAGVIVSNHGGRTLDTVAPTAECLPRIAEALRGELALLVDGGIRRGTDVLKALALGAQAVLIGRPVVNALAVAGAQGVAHVIRLLRDELEIAMALTGCRTLAEVSARVLHDRPTPG